MPTKSRMKLPAAIAKKLGCNNFFGFLAGFLYATMPIAFAEALSTQVDVFATVWMLLFVYYYIDIYEEEHIAADRRTMRKCLIMAVCVAFGYLTKPYSQVAVASEIVDFFQSFKECFLREFLRNMCIMRK